MGRALIWLTALALVAGACSGNDDDGTAEAPADSSAQGDEGAALVALDLPERDFRTVVSDDGNAMVLIPAGDDTDVTIDVLESADYPPFLAGAEQGDGTALYELGPDGATFDEPVRYFRRVELANLSADLDPFDLPLLLTYTTDDDGNAVLAADPSILRTGDSVWVGASFDHFSPAITVNTQKELSTNEVFGQLINSIKVADGPPPTDGFRGLDDEQRDALGGLAAGESSGVPISFLDVDGPGAVPVHASLFDTPLPDAGEIDLAMRAADGTFPVPDLDVMEIEVFGDDGSMTDTASIGMPSLRTAYGDLGLPDTRFPWGTVGGVELEFEDLDNPLGDPITTGVDVGVLTTDPGTLAEGLDIMAEIAALADENGPVDLGIIRIPPEVAMTVDVAHGTGESDLITRLLWEAEQPGNVLNGMFLLSLFGDPADGPVPVTGFDSLSGEEGDAEGTVRIDSYGDWRLAVVDAPDGIDQSAAMQVVLEGDTAFLEIDGTRTELRTGILRSGPGGPAAGITVDAAEGRVFESQVFLDGFESGDTSAWTGP